MNTLMRMIGIGGVVGLLASCSAGGITTGNSDNESVAETSGQSCSVVASENFLFASQYLKRTTAEGNATGAWVKTLEEGWLFSFNSAAWNTTWETAVDAEIEERQSYGKQYAHAQSISSATDYFGMAVKAPNNQCADISSTDTLVLQMGNGAATTGMYAAPNSHMVFTVELNGGSQPGLDAQDYTWTQSCGTDVSLAQDSRPGQTGAHEYGLKTYEISLSSLTCAQGSITELKQDLEEVVVKVVGGKDATADASSSSNDTLLSLGWIGFKGTRAVNEANAPFVLFASQFTNTPDNASLQAQTMEGGDVRAFSSGNFRYAWEVASASEKVTRQSYGVQYYHDNTTLDNSSRFGLTIQGPDNGSVDISASDTMLIQMGNGTDNTSFPKAHHVFSVSLSGSHSSLNACSIDVNLDNASRPQIDSNSNYYGGYGLRTYSLDLPSFTCDSGTLSDLKKSVQEVTVEVIGGKDSVADQSDNSSGSALNHTLLSVGFIGFSQ